MERKVVIWGTGRYYDRLRIYLNECVLRKEIKIVALISSFDEAFAYLDGIPVMKPDILEKLSFDYLIIASDYEKEILMDAKKYVKESKIIRGSITESDYFDFYRYFKIRENNVSIISDTCWGGFVYHLLGMEFSSPLINTLVLEEDFLRLIHDVPYWFHLPLKEKRSKQSEKPYPVGILEDENGGGVEIQFLHSKTFCEASEEWNRRIKRFHYNNYLVQMNVMNVEAALRFSKVNPEGMVRKIGFSPTDFESGIKDIFCLDEWKNEKCRNFFIRFNRLVHNGVIFKPHGSRPYDIFKLLAGERDFIRKSAISKS